MLLNKFFPLTPNYKINLIHYFYYVVGWKPTLRTT